MGQIDPAIKEEWYQKKERVRKAEFEYENRLFALKKAKDQMKDFEYQVMLILGFYIAAALVGVCEPQRLFFLIKNQMITSCLGGVVVVLFSFFSICGTYNLWKIRFGFRYKPIRNGVKEREEELAAYAAEVSRCTYALENFEMEHHLFVEEDCPEPEDKGQMPIQLIQLRLERLKRERASKIQELEELNKEEAKLRKRKALSGKVLLGTIIFEVILFFATIFNLGKVAMFWGILLWMVPAIGCLPAFCFWLIACGELALGDEFILIRLIFPYFHKNSVIKKQEKAGQELLAYEKECAKLEKQLNL